MGDMPIGKLLDHIEFELITLDNFAQFAADCDEKMVAKGFDVEPVPPIEDPDKDAIAALTEVGAGTPTDMLLELLAWRNGGFSVFEYEIHNAPQILAEDGSKLDELLGKLCKYDKRSASGAYHNVVEDDEAYAEKLQCQLTARMAYEEIRGRHTGRAPPSA